MQSVFKQYNILCSGWLKKPIISFLEWFYLHLRDGGSVLQNQIPIFAAEDQATPDKSETDSRRHGMTLPFKPLSMTFHNVSYFVDMPKVNFTRLLYYLCGKHLTGAN